MSKKAKSANPTASKKSSIQPVPSIGRPSKKTAVAPAKTKLTPKKKTNAIVATSKRRSRKIDPFEPQPLKLTPEIPATVVMTTPTPERPYLIERILTGEETAAEYRARQKQLDAEFVEARAVLKKWAPKLRKTVQYKKGHITGMTVRYRTKFGHPVSPLQVVIAINVATKFPETNLKTRGLDLLPASIDGVPIKVLEGSFELLKLTAASTTMPNNPLPFTSMLVGGVPIAPPGQTIHYGTLGVVQDDGRGGWIGITAGHVVNSSPTMEQLGPPNAGSSTTRPLGTALDSKQGDFSRNGVTETLDCASIEIKQQAAPVPPIVLPAANSGSIRDITTTGAAVPLLYSGRRVDSSFTSFYVLKFGATTGQLRVGMILDYDQSEVTINGKTFRNNFTIKAQAPSNQFVEDGDSGSLVVLDTKVGGTRAFVAIGILFARLKDNSSIGVACNMCEVLNAITTKIPPSKIIK